MSYLELVHGVLDEVWIAARKVLSEGGVSIPVGRGAYGDVTYRIDRVVEEAAIGAIKRALPESMIISEEAGVVGGERGRPLILLDPVDGSTNASRGVPFYSSAVAIVDGYRLRDVAAAGVIDLMNGDRIMAAHGGVTLNGRAAHPSSSRDLDGGYVNINMKIREGESSDSRWLTSLLNRVKYPRFLGSAALETAYVAIGRTDGFVQIAPNLRIFDCLGALFMVKEAGGFIRYLNLDLEEVDLRTSVRLSYVAACSLELGNSIMSLKV